MSTHHTNHTNAAHLARPCHTLGLFVPFVWFVDEIGCACGAQSGGEGLRVRGPAMGLSVSRAG